MRRLYDRSMDFLIECWNRIENKFDYSKHVFKPEPPPIGYNSFFNHDEVLYLWLNGYIKFEKDNLPMFGFSITNTGAIQVVTEIDARVYKKYEEESMEESGR